MRADLKLRHNQNCRWDIYSFVRSIVEAIILILSYISIMYFLYTRKTIYTFFKLIILSYYIIFIIAIIQKFFPKVWIYIYPVIHSGFAYDPFSPRLYSTFTEPSWFTSSLNLLIIPITYSMILSGQYFLNNLIIKFSFISSIYLIIISTSRIGLITLLLLLIGGYISYIIFDKNSSYKKKILKLLFQGFTIIITSIIIIQNKEFNTLSNIENDYSNITRLSCAIVGINIFKDFPWGIGFHNTSLFFKEKYLPDFLPITPEVEMFIEKSRKGNTKNMYSRLLAETGIIGFFIYFGYIIFLYVKSLKKTNILFFKIYTTLILLSLLIVYTNTDSFMTTETLISIAILRFLALKKL